jgi:hypothetical protein
VSSTEANYSVTFKTPKGNLLTVRGDTSLDWVANLEAAGKSGALGLISQIEASLAGPQANPTRPPVTGGSPATTATAVAHSPQPAQELPAGMGVKCDTCQAPAKFVQEGTSKQSGKPYKRYACTANQLHKATFTN